MEINRVNKLVIVGLNNRCTIMAKIETFGLFETKSYFDLNAMCVIRKTKHQNFKTFVQIFETCSQVFQNGKRSLKPKDSQNQQFLSAFLVEP